MPERQFQCSTCGQMHPISDIELAFKRPDLIAAMSLEEINARCQYNNDLYVLDGERFFVRGTIPLPVVDYHEPYSIGAWAEVNLESFQRIYDLWDDEPQANEPAFPGMLANTLPGHTRSLGASLKLQLTGPLTRPHFEILSTDAELSDQQKNGISRHVAYGYTMLIPD